MRSHVRSAVITIALSMAALGAFSAVDTSPVRAQVATPVVAEAPMLAYYYIWFDPNSWERAKVDYPTVGRYSSDDVDVMRQHVKLAKSAGIDGFIVSWKDTPTLDRRLEQLIQVADAENFKLEIIYEGLDFSRNPLAPATVGHDLDTFIDKYASDRAFNLFDKPVVIWSGTWAYTTEEVASVTTPRRADLRILASEKNVAGYRRLSTSVDGNAYYWSSVNPDTFPGYSDKLQSMSALVHADGGIWIAPAAPGFDARGIGGTSVVDRAGGQTLRREYAAADASSPDAIGLISWNEFSENTHIEPSLEYGHTYVDLVRSLRAGGAPSAANRADSTDHVDSSSPDGRSLGARIPILVAAALLLTAGTIVVVRRRREERRVG